MTNIINPEEIINIIYSHCQTKLSFEIFNSEESNDTLFLIDNKVSVSYRAMEYEVLPNIKSIKVGWCIDPFGIEDIECKFCARNHRTELISIFSNPIEAIIMAVKAIETIELLHEVSLTIEDRLNKGDLGGNSKGSN